jgi:Flp pilus assembly protein TadD
VPARPPTSRSKPWPASRAIRLGSTDPGAFNDRGNVLRNLQRADAALQSFDRAIDLRPDYAEAYSNRGNALYDLGRSPEALASYARAIALRRDYAEAFNHRGNALHDLDRLQEALASYAQALALRPDYLDALANRAGVPSVLGQRAAALQSYDQALALQPNHPAAHFGRSGCMLQQGDFARGWAEYEWRWRMPRQTERAGRLAQPPWLGAEPLAGKTILLHAEQGFGDTLQFCRYAAPLAERAAHVLLVVPRPFAGLLTVLDGPAKVLSAGDTLPEFDLHCPLLSLPLALGTTLESIPPPAHPTPPPDRVADGAYGSPHCPSRAPASAGPAPQAATIRPRARLPGVARSPWRTTRHWPTTPERPSSHCRRARPRRKPPPHQLAWPCTTGPPSCMTSPIPRR